MVLSARPLLQVEQEARRRQLDEKARRMKTMTGTIIESPSPSSHFADVLGDLDEERKSLVASGLVARQLLQEGYGGLLYCVLLRCISST